MVLLMEKRISMRKGDNWPHHRNNLNSYRKKKEKDYVSTTGKRADTDQVSMMEEETA